MNRTKRDLKLTDAQWEILEHRLEVPDCIADALCDDDPEPGTPTYHRQDVEECATELCNGTTDIDAVEMVYGRRLTHAVLQDAVEGSTWMGGAYDEADHTGDDLKAARAARSGEALARKIGEYIGRKVDFPDY